MGDAGDTGAHAGFLPPQPSGPEPDLRDRPAERAPEPAGPLPGGYAPPAEHEAHAPTQPPAWQQPGWSAPPPGQAAPWGHGAPPAVPDNGSAVAGLSLSLTSAGLLLLSVGTSSIISVVCAILGIHYGRKGRQRVDRGETPKHRGAAQAGFVIGIVALGFSLLATLLWGLYALDGDFRSRVDEELEEEDGDSPGGFETSLRLASVAVRLLSASIG